MRIFLKSPPQPPTDVQQLASLNNDGASSLSDGSVSLEDGTGNL